MPLISSCETSDGKLQIGVGWRYDRGERKGQSTPGESHQGSGSQSAQQPQSSTAFRVNDMFRVRGNELKRRQKEYLEVIPWTNGYMCSHPTPSTCELASQYLQ